MAGLGHVVAISLYGCWLRTITSSLPDKFTLLGSNRGLQISALASSVFCSLVPLFQLNARLAQGGTLWQGSGIAPHELAG